MPQTAPSMWIFFPLFILMILSIYIIMSSLFNFYYQPHNIIPTHYLGWKW